MVAVGESIASFYLCQRFDIELLKAILMVALLMFILSQVLFWTDFNFDHAPAVNYVCFLVGALSFLAVSQASLALYQDIASEAQQLIPGALTGLSMSVHRYLQIYCNPRIKPLEIDVETLSETCSKAALIDSYIEKNRQNITLSSISGLVNNDILKTTKPELLYAPYGTRELDAEPAALRDFQNIFNRVDLLRRLLVYPVEYERVYNDLSWIKYLDKPVMKIYLSWILLNVTFMKLGLILAQKRQVNK
jgi:hypothetical protein